MCFSSVSRREKGDKAATEAPFFLAFSNFDCADVAAAFQRVIHPPPARLPFMIMSTNAYGFDFLKSEHQLDGNDAAPPRPAYESFSSTRSMLSDVPDLSAVRLMTTNEKIFIINNFLKAHRSAGYLAPSVIFKSTGIDLIDRDADVARELERKENIAVEQVPDPENPSLMLSTYAYQSKFSHVRDRKSLVAQINSSKNGVRMSFLVDTYEGAHTDIWNLITAGDIIACENKELKDKILFPRGESFLVELDGIVTVKNGAVVPPTSMSNGPTVQRLANPSDYLVETDVDPTVQIRRGEAVSVGDQWFRVSSAVQEGPLSEQPVRAQARLSAVSILPLPADQRNELDGYLRPFNSKILPLDHPLAPYAKENLLKAKQSRDQLHKLAGARGLSGGVAAQLLSPLASSTNPSTLAQSFATGGSTNKRKQPTAQKSSLIASEQAQKDAAAAQKAATDPSLALYTHARRHGCTTDVRNMYLKTQELLPESEEDLHKLMVKHKLLDPSEAIRRPRLERKPNVDNDGKPKKRRYYERKNQRMTNVHLVGTEIGNILEAAKEKQQQGKNVGDGGM